MSVQVIAANIQQNKRKIIKALQTASLNWKGRVLVNININKSLFCDTNECKIFY